MHDLTIQQAAEKAYQAEIILALICEKSVVHMGGCEVDALLVMVKKLIGDVGGFLGEEESRAEVSGGNHGS